MTSSISSEQHSPTKSSKSKKSKKRNSFEYRHSDDEDELEDPMWQTKEQHQRQQDALKTPFNADTDPFIMRCWAKGVAADKAAATAAAAAEEEDAAEEDDCIRSDAYESVANLSEIGDEMEMGEETLDLIEIDNRLKMGKEQEREVTVDLTEIDIRPVMGEEEGKEKTVDRTKIDIRRVIRRAPSIPSDSYAPMDIVERLPQEEEEAMRRQFVSNLSGDDHPAPLPPQEQGSLTNVVERFFNAPHVVSLPASFNADNADDAPHLEIADEDENSKFAKLITPKRVSIKIRAQIDSIKPKISKLKAIEIIPLYETVSKDLLPEILANTLACLNYLKMNKEKVGIVLSHWSSFFSIFEKRRFLASAAKFTAFLDMPEWIRMLRYDRFNIMMLVHPRRNDGLMRQIVGDLRGDGKEVLRQIKKWIDYETEDLISILQESVFMNSNLQTYLLPRINNTMFTKGARLVAACFGLPFPPKLIKQHIPLNLGLAFAAYKKGEMGSRDLAVTAAEMARDNPKLWELASGIVAERRGAAATLREFQEKGGLAISNVRHCWTNPLPKTHLSLRWTGLVDEGQLGRARTEVESSSGIVSIAYRLTNRPTYAPNIAAIIYQFGNLEQKFWLSCLKVTSGKRLLKRNETFPA